MANVAVSRLCLSESRRDVTRNAVATRRNAVTSWRSARAGDGVASDERRRSVDTPVPRCGKQVKHPTLKANGNAKAETPRNDRRRLAPKQARFIQEYMVDLNGTQAAIRAARRPKWQILLTKNI